MDLKQIGMHVKKKIIKSLSLNCCKHDNKMNTKSKINKIKRKKSSTCINVNKRFCLKKVNTSVPTDLILHIHVPVIR